MEFQSKNDKEHKFTSEGARPVEPSRSNEGMIWIDV